VFKQGSPILDSDTHEVIGYSEKELGQIVVTEVEPKLSKASSQMDHGSDCRCKRINRASGGSISECTGWFYREEFKLKPK